MFTIGIEGLVRAGKSTLSNFLSKTLNAKLIPEYGVYTKGSAAFPKYPSTTVEEAIKAVNFFTEIERLRLNDLSESDEVVIVDRTYLTCIAFDHAASHFTGFDILTESCRIWHNSVKINPDLLIFLNVSDEELDKRIAPDKAVYRPHFYQPEFNFYIREFFTNFTGLIIGKDVRVVSINADQEPAIVQQEALFLIQRFRET